MADKNNNFIKVNKYRVKPDNKISLKDYDTDYEGDDLTKELGIELLEQTKEKMSIIQDELYAYNKYSVLIVFQAMDAAGKDSAVKHVLSGLNPAGVKVFSFKAPNANELERNYLWRHTIVLPQRGEIGIFNRSHYENVLVTKVHPEFLLKENLPDINSIDDVNDKFWEKRYRQIRDFEKILYENGTLILKFFLHLSSKEQKKRFIERVENPRKNWKFSPADIEERKFWKDYQRAYEDALSNTSTDYAPWFVIPADTKWFTRLAISTVIINYMDMLKMSYPKVPEETMEKLNKLRQQMEKEKAEKNN